LPLKLNGSTSGYTQIQAAAVAANNTLTLPNSGTNLLSDATLPTTTPTNGQIPIGNGTTYVPATITAGTGITVTNGAGSISIANTGGAVAATQLAKAWVNFNGSGSATIRASYNVSSVTYNGTGDYTVNFTTALADANYAPVISTRAVGSPNTTQVGLFRYYSGSPQNQAPTTSAFRFFTVVQGTTNGTDSDYVCVAVFGN